MKKNNYYYDTAISIVKPSGEIIDIKRKKGEKSHPEIFTRIDKENMPGLLDNYILDITVSSGYELAGFAAAKGNCIIFPADLENNEIMMLFVPKIPTLGQREAVKKLLKELEGLYLYGAICSFKDRTSPVVEINSLKSTGDFLDTYTKVIKYFDSVESLDSLLDDTDTDEKNIEDVTRGKK